MMSYPMQIDTSTLPDISASWSNRNGGEVLLTGGSVRAVMSAAFAQDIADKLRRALDVPRKAAEMAARPPAPEPERIAEPEASIVEPLDRRRRALGARFPFRVKRLQAIERAIENAGPMAESVVVGVIPFTMAEAEAIRASLSIDAGEDAAKREYE